MIQVFGSPNHLLLNTLSPTSMYSTVVIWICISWTTTGRSTRFVYLSIHPKCDTLVSISHPRVHCTFSLPDLQLFLFSNSIVVFSDQPWYLISLVYSRRRFQLINLNRLNAVSCSIPIRWFKSVTKHLIIQYDSLQLLPGSLSKYMPARKLEHI